MLLKVFSKKERVQVTSKFGFWQREVLAILMVSETSPEGKSRGLAITENVLKVLLRGWKK
jgi:hypothetical protein